MMRRGPAMEAPSTDHAKVPTARIPTRTWKTAADTAAAASARQPAGSEASPGGRSPGIHPPQVRTNPRVTRQGVRCKADSQALPPPHLRRSGPAFGPADAAASIPGGAGGRDDPCPLSPTSPLTRQGAFRYGRGVRPTEVLNLRSGAATLPRMRPKASRDIRDSDIFASPGILVEPPAAESAVRNGDPTEKTERSGANKRDAQRAQSLGRAAGMRQINHQESAPGPRITKPIRGGGGQPPQHPDAAKSPRRPGLHPPEQRSPNHSSGAGSKDQKEPRSLANSSEGSEHPRLSPRKEATQSKQASDNASRNYQVERTSSRTPLPPPRRPRTLQKPTGVNSLGQSIPSRTSKLSSDEASTGRYQSEAGDASLHGPTSAVPRARAAPTSIPRARSLRQRGSRRPAGPSQAADDSRHRRSLPPHHSVVAARRDSERSSSSCPQQRTLRLSDHATDVRAPAGDRDQRLMSQSASHIPVRAAAVTRRPSLPAQQQQRPVKLRPKEPRAAGEAGPNPIFRLSLEGADSGTENSSSLATTPSECSVDIEALLEDGSSPPLVCRQTAPAGFYSVAAGPDDRSPSSGSSDGPDCERGLRGVSPRGPPPVEVTRAPGRAPDSATFCPVWPTGEAGASPAKPSGKAGGRPSEPTSVEPQSEPPTNESQGASADRRPDRPETIHSSPSEHRTSLPHRRADDYNADPKPADLSSEADLTNRTPSGISGGALTSKTPPAGVSRETDTRSCLPAAELRKEDNFTWGETERTIEPRPAVGERQASCVVDAGAELSSVRQPREEKIQARSSSVAGEPLVSSSADDLPGEQNEPSSLRSRAAEDGATASSGPIPSVKELQASSASENHADAVAVCRRRRPRRKYSTVEPPHEALLMMPQNPGDADRSPSGGDAAAAAAFAANSASGSAELERLMDGEDPVPPGPSPSLARRRDESSRLREAVLRFSSDPLPLLMDFLMSSEPPPGVPEAGGADGQRRRRRRERRAMSDVVSPTTITAVAPGRSEGETKRWSTPAALERWSRSFWSQLSVTMRSRQDIPRKAKTTEPRASRVVGEASTASRRPDVNRNWKIQATDDEGSHRQTRTPQALIGADASHTGGDSGILAATKAPQSKRWSIPLEVPRFLPPTDDELAAPGVGRGEESAVTEAPTAADPPTLRESGRQPKRRSWWRWSLPVPLRRSPRTSVPSKDSSPAKPRDVRPQDAAEETEGGRQSNRRHPQHRAETREVSAANSARVTAGSKFHRPGTEASLLTSLHVDRNGHRPSHDWPAASILPGSSAVDEPRAPPVVLRPPAAAKNRPGLSPKKRLSWKEEEYLEAVRYVEGRHFDQGGAGDEDVSVGEDDENEPRSPHTPVTFLSRGDGVSDAVGDPCPLTDPSGESTAKSRRPAVPAVPGFSPWVLPSDELKSRLESVYAEQQREGRRDASGGGRWKPAPDQNAAPDAVSPSSGGSSRSGFRHQQQHQDQQPDAGMREAASAAASAVVGKRFSLKQRLNCDGWSGAEPDEWRRPEQDGVLATSSGGSVSPLGDGTGAGITGAGGGLRPPKPAGRSRSSSGAGAAESIKDTRRKLDDVGHKTRLRIERDREGKTSTEPSSPTPNDPSVSTPPRTRKPAARLAHKSQADGGKAAEAGASLAGESMQAFRRRKKSMAIALSEGLLDLRGESQASSSPEEASELQMVSRISRLNQELMRLTQHSPPSSPPTPAYRRTPSRGSLTSLPGGAVLSHHQGFLGPIRGWKSVAQFQTAAAASSGERSPDTVSLAPELDRAGGESRKTPSVRPSSAKEETDLIREKAITPKVLLSRIQRWRKRKGQPKPKPRPEIIKLDPEETPRVLAAASSKEDGGDSGSHHPASERGSTAPLSDATNLIRRDVVPGGLVVPARHRALFGPVPLTKDTTLRKTWHGTPSRTPGEEAEGEEGAGSAAAAAAQRSDRPPGGFQRCHSLRNPVRQRKRGLSPVENAQLVVMHLSTEAIPGSSVDSGIVKDRPTTEEACVACDSDTCSSNMYSPCSSLGSSNPPSRPLSSDLVDLQWEPGSTAADCPSEVDERRLSAVSIGRRESSSKVSKARRSLVPRLSLTRSLSSPPGSPEAVASPKKVTFSLTDDPTGTAGQKDVKMPPKPRHPPRRAKTDPGDVKAVLKAAQNTDNEADVVRRTGQTRRRALSELSDPQERNQEGVVDHAQSPAPEDTPSLARPRSIPNHMSLVDGQERAVPPRKNSLADLIDTEVGEVLTSFSDEYNFEAYSPETMPTFAEALWDHVTMDEAELAFVAGDLIEVTDMRDRSWWWGCIGEREGWVPAQFVRLRVSQGETVEECVERLKGERESAASSPASMKSRKVSLSFLSNDQVRAKVVEEIITTERDYVRNLHDVCEGYINQAADRPEMFSVVIMDALFGNIEEIYSFQKGFLLQLEASILPDRPHMSRIGSCFLEHKNGFETYSEYCNNYPNALRELKLLRDRQKYCQFFEACRLLQNMIEINLEGFLLTPVQKICKYPLQLRELLKYTRPQHADHRELREALEVMQEVAVTINDRKRRIENVEKMATWQKGIGDWEGEDLLDRSTQLIHTGDISQLTGKRLTPGRRIFLFDHQLVVCKKDWKGALLYKKRIDLDVSEVEDIADGRELDWNVSVKNAFKVKDGQLMKDHVFGCKTEEEKQEWLDSFARERESVLRDREKGFSIPSAIREAAMKSVANGEQLSKPSDLTVVTRKVSTMPYAYQHKILETSGKKVPLPKGISSSDVFKKKGRGLFGIGKK